MTAGITRRGFTRSATLVVGAAGSPASASASSASTTFRDIYSGEWAWRQAQFPDDEDVDKQISPYLPAAGQAAQDARLARWRSVQKQLAALDASKLSAEDRINLAVYRNQIDTLAASQAFRDYEMPFNSDSSFWGDLTGVCRRTFRTEGDYRNYIAQLRQTRRYFGEEIWQMRAGLARGFTPPKVTLVGRDGSAASVANAASPQDAIYFKPFANMPASFAPALVAELREAGEAVIREQVIPAHAELLTFLRDTYLPGARTTLAASELPDGLAYYRSKIREFTTTELTPDQIHALGLSEMATIRARMLGVMAEVRYSGSLDAFLKSLRSDPRFYVKTSQALLDRAAWIAKTFDGKARDWFGRLPRARFAIRPVPLDQAPFYTAGRGGPGVYLLNTYDLPSRPLYALTALTLHESAPGHAFQIPLANEAEGQPEFRRKGYISAYGEGWALYCERLGEEMGMYETPLRPFRHAELSGLARRASGGRHRYPRHELEPRSRARLSEGQHRPVGAGGHHGGGPVHFMARSGPVLLSWSAGHPRGPGEGDRRPGVAVRHTQLPRHGLEPRVRAASGAHRAHRPVHQRWRREPISREWVRWRPTAGFV